MSFGKSRKSQIPLFLIALSGLMLLSACQRKTNSFDASRIHTETIESANGFIISISSGGGVSGLTNGCTLSSLGIVQQWRQAPGKEKEIITTRKMPIDAAKIRALFDENLLQASLQSPGNMSKTLTLTEREASHTWVWDASETSDVVSQFNKIWDEINSLCQTNKN